MPRTDGDFHRITFTCDVCGKIEQEEFPFNSDFHNKNITGWFVIEVSTRKDHVILCSSACVSRFVELEDIPGNDDQKKSERMTDERWDAAIAHAREYLNIYREIPTGIFGDLLIQADISRYERGERTIELLEALEGIK